MRQGILKFLDSTVGACACFILQFAGRSPSSQEPAAMARRLLVIRPGGMGDMILLLPILKMLRNSFPETEIDLVCEKRNMAILGLTDMAINPLLYDARPFGLVRRLLARDYDVVIDSEQFHNFSAVFARLSGAPLRIGFDTTPRRNRLYTKLAIYDQSGKEPEQFMKLLDHLDMTIPAYSFDGVFTQMRHELSSEVKEGFSQASAGSGFVALCPASSTRHKQWDPARFAQLATRITRELQLCVVFVGGEQDKWVETYLKDCIAGSDSIVSLIGKLTIAEASSLLARARLFVGDDSGLAHLAGALDRPTVVLFGASDPAKWGMSGNKHSVINRSLHCSPCSRLGHNPPCRKRECMELITVDDVISECGRLAGAS